MLSDDKLIDQIKYGNERAAEELITRYYASILRYCRWHCSSVEKAEDLTQEIFYKLFKNISGYQGKRKFKAYLYTIANRVCIDESRKIHFCPLEDEESIVDECNEILRLEDKEEAATGERKLSVDEVKSLIFLLLSIVLWFFGYNAVTSKYSVYASNILHKDYNLTLIIAQAAAIISYLPVGFIASKVGRKKTILAGVVMLTAAFTTASFMSAESPTMLMNAMFALAGIAWATINVNSFPMVVEMCSGGNVGKYTGFYYTASMAAQVATPMLSGLLMDRMGMHVLFPYAAVFTALAFVTMLFVRHGDSKPEVKRGLEALDEMED